MRFAGDHERLRHFSAETRDRFGLDRDNAGVEGTGDRGVGVGDQDRGQHLCKLDEIDRRSRDRTRRLRKVFEIRYVLGTYLFGNQ